MAHFAEIGTDNVILRVIAVANDVIVDENGDEQESLGETFCRDLLGGTWKQTSYNKTIRKNFAAAGYTYDSTRDTFIPPKPYASWTLDKIDLSVASAECQLTVSGINGTSHPAHGR